MAGVGRPWIHVFSQSSHGILALWFLAFCFDEWTVPWFAVARFWSFTISLSLREDYFRTRNVIFIFFFIYYTFAFQFHILIAPFHPVGFADFWLADQLNSLQTVLLDIEFFICFYSCEVGWFPNHSCKFGVIYRFCGPFYLHGNNYVDLCKGMSLIWRVCWGGMIFLGYVLMNCTWQCNYVISFMYFPM